MPKPKLYEYFRSSASYRVRIALNIKGLDYEANNIDLRTGSHYGDYRTINPQCLVPALVMNDQVFTQSLAIIDYLEHVAPEPALLPNDPVKRAHVLEMAHVIAMDIHPINNLRVLNYLTKEFKANEEDINQWYQHWIREGFQAYTAHVQQHQASNHVSFGDQITLADVCLIPQVYNALRFGLDMSKFSEIMLIYESCLKHSAFDRARPESHPDAA